MSALDAIKAALRGKSDVPADVLDEALAAAVDARDRAAAEVEVTTGELAAATLEPDNVRSRLRTNLAAARERLTDADDLTMGLTVQRDAAAWKAAEADRLARALEATADARKAADAFARDYHKAASLPLDGLERLFTAQSAVDEANRDLPHGVEQIASVEYLARSTIGAPDETLEDTVVICGCAPRLDPSCPTACRTRSWTSAAIAASSATPAACSSASAGRSGVR